MLPNILCCFVTAVIRQTSILASKYQYLRKTFCPESVADRSKMVNQYTLLASVQNCMPGFVGFDVSSMSCIGFSKCDTATGRTAIYNFIGGILQCHSGVTCVFLISSNNVWFLFVIKIFNVRGRFFGLG